MDEIEKRANHDATEIAKDDMDKAEAWQKTLRRLEALKLQERYESREEMLNSVYQYKGATIAAGNALLCHGDYMCVAGGALCSARGVSIALDTGSIEKMIDSGMLDNCMESANINSPDYSAQLNKIMASMARQARYQDAGRYCDIHGKKAAVYGDIYGKNGMGVVILDDGKDGSAYAATDNNIKPDIAYGIERMGKDPDGPIRECSYDEFNPNARDIRKALEDTANREGVNIGESFNKLQDDISKMGGDGKDISKSSGGVKTAYAAMQEDIERQENAPGHDNPEDDISPLSTSKAMRRFN